MSADLPALWLSVGGAARTRRSAPGLFSVQLTPGSRERGLSLQVLKHVMFKGEDKENQEFFDFDDVDAL